MPIFADTAQASAESVGDLPVPVRRPMEASSQPTTPKRDIPLSTILTTSVGLHLLLIAGLGFGIPVQPQRPRAARAEKPPPPIIENIQLAAPPPPVAARDILRQLPPPTPQDLPMAVPTISAVPSSVSVAFAICAIGPVHLVSDTAEASGADLAPTAVEPHEATGRSLLTPLLNYPPNALYRRITGRVVIEFHTTARGDIVDARVRTGSGHDVLDQAALENLRQGRWVGEAGYFTKTYDFVLR
jgi:protein TonB